MVVEDFVLALLVIAAAAPVVVPLIEWLFKRKQATKTTAGAGASPTPAPAVPDPLYDVEAIRDADQ